MKTGDTITFSLHACAYAVPKNNKRIVKGVTPEGGAIVRFAGYADFIVRPEEITNVQEV